MSSNPTVKKESALFKIQNMNGNKRPRSNTIACNAKAYDKQNKASVIWETVVEAAVSAYQYAGGDSLNKEYELLSRLCWFRQLLLDKIEQLQNLKPSLLSHEKLACALKMKMIQSNQSLTSNPRHQNPSTTKNGLTTTIQNNATPPTTPEMIR